MNYCAKHDREYSSEDGCWDCIEETLDEENLDDALDDMDDADELDDDDLLDDDELDGDDDFDNPFSQYREEWPDNDIP